MSLDEERYIFGYTVSQLNRILDDIEKRFVGDSDTTPVDSIGDAAISVGLARAAIAEMRGLVRSQAHLTKLHLLAFLMLRSIR